MVVTLTITGISYNLEMKDALVIQIWGQEDAFNIDIEHRSHSFNLGQSFY